MPFLNQQKGKNDRRKYFMINLHERMLPTSAGFEPATSWSPVGRGIQLSHRGRLKMLERVLGESVMLTLQQMLCNGAAKKNLLVLRGIFWADTHEALSKRTVTITKTFLYNFDPLKPHFYIVKLGFTGVFIIFRISV